MKEIWRPIKGYECLYEVSSLGRIKSVLTGKIKAKCLCKNGYYYCHLYKDNQRELKKVSRIVAEAFIPNPNNYPCINHKDENKKNDFVFINPDGTVDFEKSNLEWCSYSYNSSYGTCSNRMIKTRNNKVAKNRERPVVQYNLNGEVICEYKSMAEAEKQTGVLAVHISRVCRGVRKSAYGYVWKYKNIND